MWALLIGLSAMAAQARHALVIGANAGPAALEPLRYAEDDARRMADVLTELGGFPADRVTVLYGPDVAEVQGALAHHAALASASDDDLFVFYYSGHADAAGLRLGPETLPYTALRRSVREIPADVRVGVLDACRSGEITRIKGLSVSSPFAVDRGTSSEGEAWLTATAAEESAQESDLLGGSFFTHALVTGLRGAADRDDGVVSLAEAYAYAYDSTVARTGTTQSGIQHPAYDFRLQGRGDLPLTEVRRAEALVILPEEMEGQLHVLRAPDGALVAEIAKGRGGALTLGLPAGRYTLRLRDGDQVMEARVGLGAGSTLRVRGLTPSALAEATAKGPDAPLALPVELEGGDPPPAAPPAPAPAPASAPAAAPGGSRTFAGLDARARVALDRTAARVDERLTALLDPVEAALAGRRLPRDPLAPSELSIETAPAAAPADEPLPAQPGEAALPDGPVLLRGAGGETLAEGALSGGLRVGRWTFWYPDGARRAEGAYARGRPSGTWTWWSPRGARERRGGYEQGLPDGLWTTFWPDGSRRAQVAMTRGARDGRWLSWHKNGQKAEEGGFTQDLPDGRWTTWHENGQRASRGRYERGQREGAWTTWHPSGLPASQGRYEQGQPEGRWRSWHPSGALESQGRYEQGQREGRWRFYDEAGRLTHRARFRDGVERGR